MQEYICYDCGTVFNEFEAGRKVDYRDALSGATLSFMVCPNCLSEDFAEAEECCECNGNFARDDDMILSGEYWYCKECAERIASDVLMKWGMTEELEAGLKAYQKMVAKGKEPAREC